MIWLVYMAAMSAVGQTPSFDTFFQEFTKKRDAIQNLEARFQQQNVTPEEESEAAGRITYVKPRRIMFSYEKPQAGATYLIEARKAYVYHPDAKQLEIMPIENTAEAEAFFLGFSENTEELRKAYDVSLFEPEEASVAKYGIILRPRKDAESAPFQEVRLYLREQDYLPVRIQIVNDDESHVRIDVVDIKTNLPAGAVNVQIQAPEGTKVIENEQVIETVGPGGKTFPQSTEGAKAGEGKP